MNTELKNAVLATDLKAQYDACAKKLLGYKDILARILIEAVEEFRRMSPDEVKLLIEDDIHIGKIPVDPGLTNVVVGVDEDGKEISPKEEKHKLHRLLGALLSERLKEEEKLNILKNEYHISMEKSIKEDVKVMCNLSEGIEERGIIKGREEGRTELLKQQVQKKLAKGQSIEVIAEDLVEDVEVIRTIVDEIQAEE